MKKKRNDKGPDDQMTLRCSRRTIERTIVGLELLDAITAVLAKHGIIEDKRHGKNRNQEAER